MLMHENTLNEQKGETKSKSNPISLFYDYRKEKAIYIYSYIKGKKNLEEITFA